MPSLGLGLGYIHCSEHITGAKMALVLAAAASKSTRQPQCTQTAIISASPTATAAAAVLSCRQTRTTFH
jgi:hypothetical protein